MELTFLHYVPFLAFTLHEIVGLLHGTLKHYLIELCRNTKWYRYNEYDIGSDRRKIRNFIKDFLHNGSVGDRDDVVNYQLVDSLWYDDDSNRTRFKDEKQYPSFYWALLQATNLTLDLLTLGSYVIGIGASLLIITLACQ